MDRFIEKTNSINGDIVLLPGDILEGSDSSTESIYFEEKMREIKSVHGVFASSGNHEHYGRGGNNVPAFFGNAGINYSMTQLLLSTMHSLSKE